MTVAVIRSAGSDVTSVGGGGTTGVETLQEYQIPSSSSSSSSLEHIPERHGGRSYKKIKHIDFSIVMS